MTGAASIHLPHPGRAVAGRLFSEKRLAERAAAGDEAAFATIFERYHQPIYRYCLSILQDPDDAKDALQSTMSSALASLPGEQREIALKPWLFRVAHNHAISMIRARRDHGGDELLDGVADPRAQARPEDRERLRELIADLGTLPERQRAALTMRELNGLGFDEIGTALEMSGAAARQAVYEARVGLRRAEEGRSMECKRARELIAGGDRRSLRGLRVRAHLRACAGCTDFRAAVLQRRHDLQALCPPLAVLASAGVLQGLVGAGAGSVAAGSAVGAGAPAGAVIAGSAALKTAALVAVGAIGAGAAGYVGLTESPLGPGKSSATTREPRQADPAAVPPLAAPVPGGATKSAVSGSANPGTDGAGPGQAPVHSSAGGKPPAHSNAGGKTPPHSSAGGDTPAQAGPAGGGPPAHSNPGGTPPAHSSAGGASSPSPAPPAAPDPAPQAQAPAATPTPAPAPGGPPLAPGQGHPRPLAGG